MIYIIGLWFVIFWSVVIFETVFLGSHYELALASIIVSIALGVYIFNQDRN